MTTSIHEHNAMAIQLHGLILACGVANDAELTRRREVTRPRVTQFTNPLMLEHRR